MTKEEMIQIQLAEIMKKEFPSMYFYCRKRAEDKLKTELYITKNQKQRLSEALTSISKATGHKYSTLTYINDDIHDKKVFLGYEITDCIDEDIQKTRHYDMISGTIVSFADDIFINHQEYHIDDLIEDPDSLCF